MENFNLARITSDMYVRIAEQVCEDIKSHASTMTISVGNAEVEFNGFAYFNDRLQPCNVYPTWVECFTFDESGELVANNFRTDTLMAYINERINDNKCNYDC